MKGKSSSKKRPLKGKPGRLPGKDTDTGTIAKALKKAGTWNKPTNKIQV